MRREMWYIERMGKQAIAQYKVISRDVASEFIPAAGTTWAISDHNVHHVIVSNLNEACYIMTELLVLQVNAVVMEHELVSKARTAEVHKVPQDPHV